MQTCASEAFAALWPAVADTRIHPPDESARDPARAFTTPPENVQDIAYRYRLYPEPGFEYISPSAAAITGHTPEEHYADPDLGARLVFPQGRPSLGLDADVFVELTAPPESLPIEEMEIVWRAIGALSVDLKMALLLRDVVGLPYVEIADALETTLANVKWRIYKAREIVAAQLCREGLDLPARARSAGNGRV